MRDVSFCKIITCVGGAENRDQGRSLSLSAGLRPPPVIPPLSVRGLKALVSHVWMKEGGGGFCFIVLCVYRARGEAVVATRRKEGNLIGHPAN